MRVLVACEFSGIVRDAFLFRGHEAWSCDILPTWNEGPHLRCDVRDVLGKNWDLMIAHPPCTYLTNAGVRHLHSVPSRTGKVPKVHGDARWKEMRKAAEFFNQLKSAPIGRICIENPIPHSYAREIIGDYTQLIQPWQFGHGETKATCLWLKNLPPLQATKVVYGRRGRVHQTSPGMMRKMGRSVTYKGIARAMASQWG